jgi:hypothetical protein
MPTGSAAARQVLTIPKAGVVTKHFVGRELVRRVNHQKQECQRCGRREDVEEQPGFRADHANDRRHPHMLGSLESDNRSQHREP